MGISKEKPPWFKLPEPPVEPTPDWLPPEKNPTEESGVDRLYIDAEIPELPPDQPTNPDQDPGQSRGVTKVDYAV